MICMEMSATKVYKRHTTLQFASLGCDVCAVTVRHCDRYSNRQMRPTSLDENRASAAIKLFLLRFCLSLHSLLRNED